MAPRETILFLMAQVVLMLLRCTTSMMLFHRWHMSRRRRAAAMLLFFRHRRSTFRRLARAPPRNKIRRWYVLAELEEPREHWVCPRSLHWWDRIVSEQWDDHAWMMRFRMTKVTFLDLVEVLRPRLQRQTTTMRAPLSVERRVAVAVWCLANGCSFQVASDLFGIGRSTVAASLMEFCFAVEVELFSKTVCLGPDIGLVMEGFRNLGFPHCIGAIDGSHIPICAPGGRPDQYGNRKNFSSILLQGTVDASGRFIDAEVGWSGKNHDAFVFSHSAFCLAMDAGSLVPGNPCLDLDGVLVPPLVIADGAYPMRPWLMKPYGRSAVAEHHRNFDRRLCRARNTVERCFGRLKSRWRCLSRRLQVREQNVVSVVTAYVVLHNICEEKGHPVLSSLQSPAEVRIECDEEEDIPSNAGQLEAGKRVREALARHMASGRTPL
ncbi:uncharacterized protein LOC129335367 [Eublepharis macularius]|uniref:Uncharacterized protein LOC129335367 n=1 Tax=Eublepharis macularius TaxID=481883 RepID=A0AA97JRA3_EUBMA|nr:uncharacterized protein LOC129335367 [Eublepharis macularius]